MGTTVKKTNFYKSTIEEAHIKFCKQILNVPWYTELKTQPVEQNLADTIYL